MPTEALRIRELEVAEMRATSDAAIAAALQAVADVVREGRHTTTAEHEKQYQKLEEHGGLLLQLTAALEARGQLWARTLDFISGKAFLVGLALGGIVTVLALGPFVMASMAPVLSAGGAG